MSIPVHLHSKDRARLVKTLGELVGLYGDGLHAVALYGTAVTPAYRPKRTRMDLAVVLDELTPSRLRLMRPRIRAWAWRHIDTPLVMDPLYIDSSLDVFPLEFLELADEHTLLHGDRDPFADPEIDREHLRIEIEEQVRGKMLHLWEAYLQSRGRSSTMRRLLVQTPAGFLPTLRAMLYFAQRPRPASPAELVAETERSFACHLPTITALVAGSRIKRAELETTFDSYLGEVRSLVRIADGLGADKTHKKAIKP
ncbi:MAG: hypothetical protein VCB80_07310 [Deltaproteobacteria bacterium]